MARQPAACGTIAGYHRHIRRDEPVCGPCRDARRAYMRTVKKPCTVPGCTTKARVRGLCKRHGGNPTGTSRPRLPFQPLADYLERRHANDSHVGRYYGRQNARVFAEACGVHLRMYQEWKANGLTIRAADRVAVHLGTLPIFIWGDAFYADIPTELLEHAA